MSSPKSRSQPPPGVAQRESGVIAASPDVSTDDYVEATLDALEVCFLELGPVLGAEGVPTDFRVVRANGRSRERLARPGLVGSPWTAIATEAPAIAALTRVLATGTAADLSFRVAGAPFAVSVRRVGDSLVMTSRAAAVANRASNELMEVIEAIPDPVCVHADGTLVYVNPAFARALGHESGATLVGHRLLDLVHPDDAEGIGGLMTADEADGSPEARFARRESGFVSLEVTVRRRITFDGKPATLVFTRDATDRARAQDSLARADRLTSVGTLAAGIAHEINNPLAYVTTNLELALEELSELANNGWGLRVRQLIETLNEARGGVDRVRKIVRGVKTLSRFDEEERKDELDVRAVIDMSLRLASSEVKHQARVVTRLGEVPRVAGDEARLAQVFINIVVNAAQAVASRPPMDNVITVVTGTTPAGEAEVRIEDNGPGIPEKLRARVFEPFFTTKPAGVGTGLGLPVARSIVRSMGGDITIATSPSGGASFVVRLPASHDHRAVTAPATAVPPDSPARARLLILDDEPAIVRSLERALGRDHEVVSVLDPSVALGMLERGLRFDVILCDLMMPTMTGMEFFDEAHALDPDVAARIVFVTGGAVTHDARVFLENVNNEMIEKPVKVKALRALVARMTKRDEPRES